MGQIYFVKYSDMINPVNGLHLHYTLVEVKINHTVKPNAYGNSIVGESNLKVS